MRRLLAACGVVLAFAAEPGAQQKPEAVTAERLVAGHKDQSQWLMFGGDYTAQRHSPLTQVTPQNVTPARPPVDVPDRNPRRVGDDHPRPRRGALRHRPEQRRMGARREDRQVVLALPPDAARRPARLLRTR